MRSPPLHPLELLLLGAPAELSPRPSRAFADREFMVNQARRLCEFDAGRGVSYLTEEERRRIRRVWLEGKTERPIRHLSSGARREIAAWRSAFEAAVA